MADWVRVAGSDACAAGTLLGVRAGREAVVLANVDGHLHALEDRCSHQDYPLSDGFLEGEQLECMYHGARFDVVSGRAVALPAIRPVKTYEVDVRDDGVYVKID